jgi:DNA-binding MarR family transcriptional regulator
VYSSNKPGSIPCACTTIKKLSRILVKTYDAALAGTGINITQLAILRCIDRRVDEPLSHVAAELEMDRTSLYRAILPMERDGWIRLAQGKDARSRTAKVTRTGRNVLASAEVQWAQIQTQIIADFGKGNWSSLVADIHRLADSAQVASS